MSCLFHVLRLFFKKPLLCIGEGSAESSDVPEEHLAASFLAFGCVMLIVTASLKGDANIQIANISEELAKKTEDAARQQEEITHLLSQIVDLQKKAKAVRNLVSRLLLWFAVGVAGGRAPVLSVLELKGKFPPC